MPRSVAERLADVPAHVGWGWRYFAFALGYRLGCPPILIEGDFDCPRDQRDEEADDRAHRDRQLDNQLGLSRGMAEA